MNKVDDIPELSHLFKTFFAFIKEHHIHSFIDHMSNYKQLETIILESKLVQVHYNLRMDSYSIRMSNESNHLVDLVFLFPFGKDRNENQFMITLNNKKVYAEVIVATDLRLPMISLVKPPKRHWWEMFRRIENDKSSIMTFSEWESFLQSNNIQRPRKFKG